MLDKIVGTILLLIGLGVGTVFLFPDHVRGLTDTAQSFFQSDYSDELEPKVRASIQQELDEHWERATSNTLAALGTLLTALEVGEQNLPTKVTDVRLMKIAGKEYTGYARFNNGEKLKLKVFYDGKQFMYEST